MHTVMRSIALIAAMAMIGLSPAGALADMVKDSGSLDATFVKREMQPIPDQDGHVLDPDRSCRNQHQSQADCLTDSQVSVRELVDLRQGNGPQQGYVIYSKGADQAGRQDRRHGDDDHEGWPAEHDLQGQLGYRRGAGALTGVEGSGTYTGYFTAADKFHVDWEGTRTEAESGHRREITPERDTRRLAARAQVRAAMLFYPFLTNGLSRPPVQILTFGA